MRYCDGTTNRMVGLQSSDSVAVLSTAAPFLQVYTVPGGSLRAAPASPPSSDPWGSIAYSPNGNFLAIGLTATPFIVVYDANTMTNLSVASIPDTAMSFSFSPNSSRLAAGLYVSPFFTIFDTATWTRLSLANVPAAPARVWAVSYHPSGNLIAILTDASPWLVFYDVTTLPATKPNLVAAGNLPGGIGESIAFSPNGRFLAVAQDTLPYLIVYRTSDWSKMTITNPPTSLVHTLTWHPDSSKLVVGQTTSTYLQVFDATTWTGSNPFSIQPQETLGVTFNSRGTLLGVCHYGATAPHFFTYEAYGWFKQANVLTYPAVANNDKGSYGCAYRPGQ